MKLDLNYLRQLLLQVAEEELLSRFQQVRSRHKADGTLVTAADLASQAAIRAALAQRWPEAGFLGEEMTAAEQQQALAQQQRPLWLLDPLDGTTNYAAGMPFFSISLALLEQGRIRFGMVLDPVRGECFWAQAGEGAWLDGARLQLDPGWPASMEDGVAVIDFKRLDPQLSLALISQPPFRSQRSLGSVALEWCWMAAGRFSLYLHGAQGLWDYAAGRLILQEAGGAVLDKGYEDIGLGSRQAVAASNPALLHQWLTHLRSLPGQSL
ncbi:MAG: inositol monophosphatase [Gammaproteobacteria bacterium]|nr:inositol monophosphatase [Gammaproteobacteria bacterium]